MKHDPIFDRELSLNIESNVQKLEKDFELLFHETPQIYQAPGRVNLIGEHTDYNEGFVMPAAINFFTWVAVSPRRDRKLAVRAQNFDQQAEFSLDDIRASGDHQWSDYVLGVATVFEQAGHRIPGANLLITGDVPLGAGLSSSASLEVAVASAFAGMTSATIDSRQLALLCQRAENEFVGARCGIMDQFIAVHGRREHALLLDCRSLDYRHLPLPSKASLVICNTMIRHSVAAGEYNQRRAECEEGVRILSRRNANIKALRDVTPVDFEQLQKELPAIVRKRCRHVITEDARVEGAAIALTQGNLYAFGDLMYQSHASLRDDYEVSCPELDLMVQVAQKEDGVFGARMTGGGFGGCTVNLVKTEHADAFKDSVGKAYHQATGIAPEIYICSTADGAMHIK